MFASRLSAAAVASVIVMVIAAPAARSQSTEARTLELTVGQQRSIPARGVAKYSEGTPGIVAVRVPDDGTEFIVVGLRPGVTTLLLIQDDGHKLQYTITVNPLSSEVPKTENIRLDLYFVELSDNGSHSVGISWPTSIGDGASLSASFDLSDGSFTTATASLAGHPLPRLDLLQSTGWARVARQASVITANGKQAEFASGGELNIPVQGSLAAELRQIQFGTTVKVLPRYDKDSGRLELTIDAQFSSLAESGGSIPSRNVSTVTTVVNVEMSQAVVLAGLRARSEGASKQGLPLLSQIPVIGALFGRHSQRSQAVQNVVFIVPTIVDVVGMAARRRIDEALKHYTEFSGDLDSVRLFPEVK